MIQYQQAYNFINGITPSFVDPKVLFSADELEQIANAFKSGVDTKDVINKNKPIIKAVQQRQRELILDDHLRTIGLNIPDRMDGGFYDELKSYVSGYNLKDHSLSLTIPDNQFAALANNALNKYQGYKEDSTGKTIKIEPTPISKPSSVKVTPAERKVEVDQRTKTLFALEDFLSQIGANESVLDNDELLESALQYVAMDNGKIKVIDPDNLESLTGLNLSQFKSTPQQLANEVVAESRPKSFYTEKGSYYEINPVNDGISTKRFKTPHTNSPGDVGWKSPSIKTVFVDPEVARKIGMLQTSSAKNKRILVSDGKILHLSWNDAAGQLGKDFEDVYHISPKVGLSPLELWEPEPLPNTGHVAYAGNHPGSLIVEILNESRNPESVDGTKPITITPQQLANEVTQGTVDKNIGRAMSDYGYYGYSVGKNEDPRQMKSAQQLQQEVIEQSIAAEAIKEVAESAVNADEAGKTQNTEIDTNAPKQLNWNARVENAISDIKQGGMTNLGIGAGSIALSQMQGNGLVGTGVNLAGALGGSVLGNKYLGKALNPTVGRIGGGLAGHTIANLLMGLFRNPSEKQLLDQGMQYAQQQNGGMS